MDFTRFKPAIKADITVAMYCYAMKCISVHKKNSTEANERRKK